MKTLNLLPLLIIFLFTSCNKKLSINLPPDADRPVLNVLMNENSSLKVHLSLPGRLSGEQLSKEADYAETKLYENDTFKELLKTKAIDGKTYFVSNTVALKDKKYKVTAALPGFKLIEGSDIIPDISTIEMNNQSVIESNRDSYKLKFNFLLKNNSKEKQYYRFRILYEDNEPGKTGSKTPFYIRPVNTSDIFGFDHSEKKSWFAEKAQSADETIFYSFTADQNPGSKKMYIEISLLTETSYKYLKSISKADDSEDSPFSEKMIIHSNVQNGLGIVGGLSCKEFLIPTN